MIDSVSLRSSGLSRGCGLGGCWKSLRSPYRRWLWMMNVLVMAAVVREAAVPVMVKALASAGGIYLATAFQRSANRGEGSVNRAERERCPYENLRAMSGR